MAERAQLAVKKPEVKSGNSAIYRRKSDHSLSLSSTAERILFLQRTAGNQAVQRLIKSGALQAKLRIGQPGDIYEHEADRVADAVMRMPDPEVGRQLEPEEEEEETLQAKPLANQITPLVQVQRQEEPEEDEEELQAKATSGRISEVNPNLESHIQSLKGGGKPLPESERAYFEPRFGQDFSQVRVHSDAQAARAVNARAFTVGKDVIFGAGQYSPGTREGQRLMAHELAHVVQQKKIEKSTDSIQRKTKEEENREKAKDWLVLDANLKVEVDVLRAAIKEIKKEKSVSYNKRAGFKKLDNVAKLLDIKGNEKEKLKADWEWLVDNRKSNVKKTYKDKETSFFSALQSPLKKLKKKYPGQQTHYWLRNSPAQVLEIIHKVGDAELPVDELWAYAFKEGLVDYIRDKIGLDATDNPTEAQLKSVKVTESISGYEYLGLDDFIAGLSSKRKPLTGFLPAGFDLTKVNEIKRINEKGREVKSGEFPNMLMAVQALAAMLKRRRKLFQEDAKTFGYSTLNREELIYWTYVYFNFGEFGGKAQLNKYKGKRNLSDWIKKKEFPNSIKLLQSYRMVKEMKLF